MSESVIWRNATHNDAPEIAETHRTAWFETYSDAYPGEFMAVRTPEFFFGTWIAFLSDKRSRTLVTCVDGNIKGVIRYVADGEITTLYVLREVQRHGMGETLIDEAELDLGRVGNKEFRASVVADNAPARAFFEKHGYSVAREYTEAWDHGFSPQLVELVKPAG